MPEEPIHAPEGAEPARAGASEEEARTEDWETKFKYLFADFENFRRRAERERETLTRQARGSLLRELLPIVEGFQAAQAARNHLPASDPLRHGMDLLEREWLKFLKHQGVEPVAVVGEPFRADEAEAVGESAPREGVAPGAVAEIVQQGYRFFGGLLRPAKVIVAREPSPATAPAVEEPPDEPAGDPS